MTDDNDLKKKLQKWQVKKPSEDFANMIVQNATKHSQQTTIVGKFEDFIYKSLTDWQYGLSYKFASLTLCAFIGLSIGLNHSDAEAEEDIDIVELAFNIPEEDESL